MTISIARTPALQRSTNYIHAGRGFSDAVGVDALVAVYHSDHRELCAHERDWPFRILNFLEIVGASMGLHHDDHFKRLKMLQDADAILADCRDLVEQHGLEIEATRQAIKAM